jgi:hypothetical protein
MDTFSRLWPGRLAAGLLGLAALLAPSAAGGEPSERVHLTPHWKAGKQSFLMVKTGQKRKGGAVVQTTTTRTPVQVEVLKAGTDGYLLAWTLGEAQFDDPEQAKSPHVREMVRLATGYRLVLRVDAEGSLAAVRNWAEVRDKAERILALTTARLKDTGVDDATVAKMRAQVRAAVSTEEGVRRTCARDPHLFLSPLGRDYSTSGPLEYEAQLPNPLGGEPLPARARFSVKELDRKTGQMVVRCTQTLEPESARRMIEKLAETFAGRPGQPAPQTDLLKDLDVRDTAEFTVDLATGWLHRLRHRRVMASGDTAQVTTITITRTER